MRSVLVAVLVLLMVLPMLVSAKGVIYVTKQNAVGSPCSNLTGDDKLFCTRLEKIGYDVSIANEKDVKDNSQLWQFYIEQNDLIFLGDVSSKMVNISIDNPDRALFCNNIVASGKKVFAAFLNARKAGDLIGCAFDPLGLAGFQSSDNVCKDAKLFITESSYITRGFSGSDALSVYSSPADIRITNGTKPVVVNCDPPGTDLATGFYSPLVLTENGAFWGMDSASKLTDTGWLLFDRAVLSTTGDSGMSVIAFTIPFSATINRPVMVFAKVSNLAGPVVTGKLSASMDESLLGYLTYANKTGRWENRQLKLNQSGTLSIDAQDGSATMSISVGNLSISVLSGNYPRSYAIRALPSLNGNAADATLYYKFWDQNFNPVGAGKLEPGNGAYTANVDMGDVTGPLFLEVTGTTADGEVGGSFKLITNQSAQADATLTPVQWVVTATKPGSSTQAFQISAGKLNLSSVRVSVTGTVAQFVTLTQPSLTISPGSSASISGVMDWTNTQQGTYTGQILVDSDQAFLSIPITLNRFDISGDFLGTKQKLLKVSIPASGSTTVSIDLTNDASMPTTGFSLRTEPSEISGIASISSDPMFVPSGGQASIGIKLSAANLPEGSYNGVLIISSSLGSEEVVLNLQVGADIETMLNNMRSELETLASSGADMSLIRSANTSITSAQAALARGDTASATSSMKAANSTIMQLRAKGQGFALSGDVLIIIIVLLAAAGVGVWLFLRRSKKKQSVKDIEQKEDEMLQDSGEEKGEDEYRFKYY